MDFRLSDSSDEVRARVRAFLEDQVTPELVERVYRSGVSHDPDFVHALVEGGWVAPSWPVEYGGLGLDPLEQLAVEEELRLSDSPTYGIGVALLVAGVIRVVGTEAQKEAVIPRVLRGELVIALGFTEPEAGSDVSACATRAERDGDHWVINGQKMFTTNAQVADYVFLLARSDPGSTKHRGLTMFLVPMDQPGIEVQAVYTLSGERTNITYYNDVRVSDEWRIGGADDGWNTMTVALGLEHGNGFGPALERLLLAAEAWAAEAVDDDGAPVLDDPSVREALARTAADREVAFLLRRRVAWQQAQGVHGTTEGPMSKLFSSEALTARAEELAALMGPDGLRAYLSPAAPADGEVEYQRRFAVGTRIYAGTSEIHRNMIAQRGLGLPRTR